MASLLGGEAAADLAQPGQQAMPAASWVVKALVEATPIRAGIG